MSDDKKDRPVGARWWRESLATSQLLGRRVVTGFGLFGGAAVGLTGCFDDLQVRPDEPLISEERDEVERSMDALELQKHEGWNVGHADAPLGLPSPVEVDVAGSAGWRDQMESLAAALQPAQPQLIPFYTPTLFQSLVGPQNRGLREAMRPIRTPEMDGAYARGRAILSLFAEAGWPTDTAIIADVPGP
jgi:hypothetical protein